MPITFEPVDGFSNVKKVNDLEFRALSIGSVLDPDPDPDPQKRLDPDPDPDPPKKNADPKH